MYYPLYLNYTKKSQTAICNHDSEQIFVSTTTSNNYNVTAIWRRNPNTHIAIINNKKI